MKELSKNLFYTSGNPVLDTKAVQLYIANEPIMAVGREGCVDLLEGILMEKQIPFQRGLVPGFNREVPKLEGKGYRVAGMGEATLSNVRLWLSGESEIYGLTPDVTHAQEFAKVNGTLEVKAFEKNEQELGAAFPIEMSEHYGKE